MKWYKGKRIYLRRVNNIINAFGLNLKKLYYLKNIFRFFFEIKKFISKGGKIKSIYPFLDDYEVNAGNIKNQLFHADLLISQCINKNKPEKHLDIGSRIDGLVAHVASFRNIDVLDIRNIDISPHRNINFIKADINEFSEKSVYDSISSIGVISHIGLGRYGDTIDPEGHKSAIKKICNLIKVKGLIYIMVPVGKPGVEFNSHRVFYPTEIIDYFNDYNCKLINFHLVDDDGDLHLNFDINLANKYNFGGGIYVFEKN